MIFFLSPEEYCCAAIIMIQMAKVIKDAIHPEVIHNTLYAMRLIIGDANRIAKRPRGLSIA